MASRCAIGYAEAARAFMAACVQRHSAKQCVLLALLLLPRSGIVPCATVSAARC